MGKLQLKNPDELELRVGHARMSSLRHSRTETLPRKFGSDANRTTQIEETKEAIRPWPELQEKDLGQRSLTSKYARVLCCSFERERGN